MLTDVYGHVMIDPSGDEWRDFWLDAYSRQTRPTAAKRRGGVVPLWSESETKAQTACKDLRSSLQES